MQNNTDVFSWKRREDKSSKFKKRVSFASQPFFFFFLLIFLFQRWFKESIYSFF